MMHGKAIGKLGIGEIAKVSKGNAIRVEGGGGGVTAPHMNSHPQQEPNVLMLTGLWPTSIKLNPS